MKILLLGATGKVGRLILEQALERGFHVTALARHPEKITIQHPNLTIMPGSPANPVALAEAVDGVDVVMSALGHNSTKSSTIQTDATRAVLATIKPGQRFISLTGQGVRDPQDPAQTVADRFITSIIKSMPGGVFADGVEHARLIRESRANWTIVRSPIMAGGPKSRYEAGYFKIGLTTKARRADVASFMLDCATSDTWLQQAPMVVSR